MSVPNSRTVLQVHTGHNAEHHRPGDNRREHSAKRNITSKNEHATAVVDVERGHEESERGGPRRPPLPHLLPLPLGPPVLEDVSDPLDLLRRAQRVGFLLLLPLPPLLLLPSLLQRALEEKRDQWAVVHLTDSEVQQRLWLRSDLGVPRESPWSLLAPAAPAPSGHPPPP